MIIEAINVAEAYNELDQIYYGSLTKTFRLAEVRNVLANFDKLEKKIKKNVHNYIKAEVDRNYNDCDWVFSITSYSQDGIIFIFNLEEKDGIYTPMLCVGEDVGITLGDSIVNFFKSFIHNCNIKEY